MSQRGFVSPDAAAAKFPLGGIGTGNVSIGSRGQLLDWELTGNPGKGDTLPFSFFAIDARGDGSEPVTRVLQSRIQPPHDGDHGYYAGEVAGLPRLESSRMYGEYPLLEIEFDDRVLPVSVTLEAFTPMVPLDADSSGIPAAVLRYKVRNETDRPLDVSVAGALANPVGITGYDDFHFPTFAGNPRNEYRDESGCRGIHYSTDLSESDLRFGNASLTTTDANTTAKPQWLYGVWQDGVQSFWDDFRADGRLEPEERESFDTELPDWITKLRVGSIAISHRIEPGDTYDFEFVLSWYFPNRPKAWLGNIVHINPHADEIVQNHYATRYADSWDVARQLVAGLPALEAKTRAFHAALFGGTLPAEVVHAVSGTLTAARSTTCFRLADGTFAAWEGSFNHHGSCEGTCTHVWNYAQSLAFLYPELERSARKVEFGLETRDDGRMNFRANQIFDSPAWDFHPAVDGQLGTIVRLYRDWKFSGDDEFVRELWPAASRALDFAFSFWDSDGDFVLDSQKHNTYDIEFYGADSLSNSVFYAALRAGAALARHLGDTEAADRWTDAAELGSARMDELLFNGEYYEQVLENPELDASGQRRYQYGTGVLSDQVFGQFLAHVAGLGHVLPADHVRSAIRSVFEYNFRPSLLDHHSVQRTYALGDEAGLLLCSWPRGGRPRIPFVYSDEVWTGIEYQVASTLMFEGLVDEGLTIVRATRDRHNGHNRNPWNDVECGNHYARSMSSWALLLALSGVEYDARARSLEFAPRLGGSFSSFFSTGSAWGRVSIDADGAELFVDHGRLTLDSFAVSGRPMTAATGTFPGLEIEAGSSIHFSPSTDQGAPA